MGVGKLVVVMKIGGKCCLEGSMFRVWVVWGVFEECG